MSIRQPSISSLTIFSQAQAIVPPSQIYNKRLYTTALIVSVAAIIIGYDAGFIGGLITLKSFLVEFDLWDKPALEVSLVKELIISNFQIGAIVGSGGFYFINWYIGNYRSLFLSTFFLLLGSFLQACVSKDNGLDPLLYGRFFSGVGVGGVSNLAPVYITEISPSDIRGQLIGTYEICWQVGGIFGFWINFFTSSYLTFGKNQWFVPIIIQLVPCVVFFIGLFFIVESPRWLITKGQEEKALKNLSILRNLPYDNDYLNHEFDQLLKQSYYNQSDIGNSILDPFRKVWYTRNIRRRVFLSTSLSFIQNIMGINAINYYSPTIFKQLGLSSQSATLLSTGVFGLIKGICCFLWAFYIVDKYGRRIPNLVGLCVCSFCMFYIGFYIKFCHSDTDKMNSSTSHESNFWKLSAISFFYLWTVSYALSWSGSPWVLFSEIFETKVRIATQSINSSVNWFWNYVMARYTESLIIRLHYGLFIVFAVGMLISLVFYYQFYPETKGIPLEDIDLLFEDGVHPKDSHSRATGIINSRSNECGISRSGDECGYDDSTVGLISQSDTNYSR